MGTPKEYIKFARNTSKDQVKANLEASKVIAKVFEKAYYNRCKKEIKANNIINYKKGDKWAYGFNTGIYKALGVLKKELTK